MKTIKYDKLVRDKIPEIIEKSGKKCVVEVMDKEIYIQYLDRKLNEELAEYPVSYTHLTLPTTSRV